VQGGQPVRDQEPHFLLCYCKEPHHPHEHTQTSPHSFAQLDSLIHIPSGAQREGKNGATAPGIQTRGI